jgi:hypothetical protein
MEPAAIKPARTVPVTTTLFRDTEIQRIFMALTQGQARRGLKIPPRMATPLTTVAERQTGALGIRRRKMMAMALVSTVPIRAEVLLTIIAKTAARILYLTSGQSSGFPKVKKNVPAY